LTFCVRGTKAGHPLCFQIEMEITPETSSTRFKSNNCAWQYDTPKSTKRGMEKASFELRGKPGEASTFLSCKETRPFGGVHRGLRKNGWDKKAGGSLNQDRNVKKPRLLKERLKAQVSDMTGQERGWSLFCED